MEGNKEEKSSPYWLTSGSVRSRSRTGVSFHSTKCYQLSLMGPVDFLHPQADSAGETWKICETLNTLSNPSKRNRGTDLNTLSSCDSTWLSESFLLLRHFNIHLGFYCLGFFSPVCLGSLLWKTDCSRTMVIKRELCKPPLWTTTPVYLFFILSVAQVYRNWPFCSSLLARTREAACWALICGHWQFVALSEQKWEGLEAEYTGNEPGKTNQNAIPLFLRCM